MARRPDCPAESKMLCRRPDWNPVAPTFQHFVRSGLRANVSFTRKRFHVAPIRGDTENVGTSGFQKVAQKTFPRRPDWSPNLGNVQTFLLSVRRANIFGRGFDAVHRANVFMNFAPIGATCKHFAGASETGPNRGDVETFWGCLQMFLRRTCLHVAPMKIKRFHVAPIANVCTSVLWRPRKNVCTSPIWATCKQKNVCTSPRFAC